MSDRKPEAKKAAKKTTKAPAKKTAAKKAAKAPAKKATKTAKAAPEPVADEVEPEVPPTNDVDTADDATSAADEAEAQRQLERLAAALAAIDDDTVRHAVTSMSETSRTELAETLQLPKATMHLGGALPPLLRRKLRNAAAPRQLSAAFGLTEAVNDETVLALGDRHDDPTRDDLLAVLPAVVDHHGVPLVTVLLAAYAVSDAQVQAVAGELLDTDERFAIGDPIDDERAATAPASASSDAAASTETEAEREARREERRAAKAARKAAERHEREAQQSAHRARRDAQRNAKRGS